MADISIDDPNVIQAPMVDGHNLDTFGRLSKWKNVEASFDLYEVESPGRREGKSDGNGLALRTKDCRKEKFRG